MALSMWGGQTFFKGFLVNILGFTATLCTTNTQLCCYTVKARFFMNVVELFEIPF